MKLNSPFKITRLLNFGWVGLRVFLIVGHFLLVVKGSRGSVDHHHVVIGFLQLLL